MLVELYRARGLNPVARAIQLRAVDLRAPRRYYLLQDSKGERMAGNLPAMNTEGGVPVLCVADSGPGIPKPEREKVFRRFYRLESSRTTPGSGLGLALMKAVADLHGASINLSDNGPGLRVTVRPS